MIGIGIIGYGYWGPNLVRNLAETPGARVVAVSDLRQDRLAVAQARYPTIQTTTDYHDLFANPAIDAIIVATPVATHYDLALQALRAGKHVLVEKPLVPTVDEGLRLLDEAARQRRTIMVDHTFVYTGAVRKIKEIVTSGCLGPIYYYDSVRVNLGLFQHDINVLWDLAVHDLAIMDYVLDARPCAVSAIGVAHVGHKEDIAYLTCLFDNSTIAHIHVNWLAPVKIRRTLIGGGQQMIVYDDLEPSEKVKVYDRGVTVERSNGNGNDNGNGNNSAVYELLVGYRAGDMWAPKLSTAEALHNEMLHFIDCIEHDKIPETSAHVGLRVVHILETANRSLSQQGQPIELSWERLPA
jgi:predicted dehydrogenase